MTHPGSPVPKAQTDRPRNTQNHQRRSETQIKITDKNIHTNLFEALCISIKKLSPPSLIHAAD